jgi:hypothetical protein
MKLLGRILLVNAILAGGWAAQWALSHHLQARGQLAYTDIRKSITQLPETLTPSADAAVGWTGQTNVHEELIRKQLPFVPDDLVSRTYLLPGSNLSVSLYAVFSRDGSDRKHHPEVCIRDVTGAPEDAAARLVLYMENDSSRPIQRFRFRTSATQHTIVYYWHYTFPRIPLDGESRLQVLYQRLSKPAPSITVQVSTTAEMEHAKAIESGFLEALDQLLRRDYLPPGTVMACDRMPIALSRR